MDRPETMKILSVLKAAYPQYYKGLDRAGAESVVNLWMVQFREDAYTDVSVAVHGLISSRTSTFPPVIGEVKEALRQVTHPDGIGADEAWALVMKAVRRGSVHAVEDWQKLPPEVQASITPETIKSMATNEEFNEGVEKSLFFRSWQAARERQRQRETLPSSLREQIEARKLALEQVREEPLIETKAEPPAPPVEDRIPVDIRELLRKRRNNG